MYQLILPQSRELIECSHIIVVLKIRNLLFTYPLFLDLVEMSTFAHHGLEEPRFLIFNESPCVTCSTCASSTADAMYIFTHVHRGVV